MASLSSTRNMFNFVLLLYFLGFGVMIVRWRNIEFAGGKNADSEMQQRDERDVHPSGTQHFEETPHDVRQDGSLQVETKMPVLDMDSAAGSKEAVKEKYRSEIASKKREKKGVVSKKYVPEKDKRTKVEQPPPPVAEVPIKTKDKIVGKTKNKIVDKPEDKPMDELKYKTKDKTVGKTKNKIVDKPEDKPMDELKYKTKDKTVDKTVDKIVDKPEDKPMDKSKDKTEYKPVDKTVDKSGDKNIEQAPARQSQSQGEARAPDIQEKESPRRKKTKSKFRGKLDEKALWAKEQAKRKETLRGACADLGLDSNITQIAKEQKRRLWPFIVEDKYRLIYTFISKVASTNWKSAFLVLQGKYATVEDVPGKFAHSPSLVRLTAFTDDGVRQRLSNFTNFIFVRHPFARVLSAYRNKFLEHKAFARGTAIQIIKRYRQNATREALASGSDVTFPEFVKYLINGKVANFDGHWQPIYRMVLPCAVRFDYIGKLETGEEDAKYILKETHVDHLVHFKDSKRNVSHDDSIFNQFFSQVPSADLVQLYRVYEPDFKLFGYDVPDSMKALFKGI